MPWRFHSRSPVFVQIADRIRGDILKGVYPPNSQIPPVRQLALEASVNPNTVQHALSALEEEGLLYSKGTVGRFVTGESAILDAATRAAHDNVMRAMLDEALALGISREELIEFIKKEEPTE